MIEESVAKRHQKLVLAMQALAYGWLDEKMPDRRRFDRHDMALAYIAGMRVGAETRP